ncbi:hypothetical protein CSB11_01910 [Candidatus Campbellbacteria bacterium]|nr:MAG: hypothetical protein CSB11_01910 [Candidatus Campbellbacteria bacterium]
MKKIINISKNFFKNLGPAFLVIALGIGSGEFILWPFLSANYGFGILYGALFGIFLQLVLLNIITKNTIFLKDDIVSIFKKVFKYSGVLIIFTTLIGFGWPAFAALSSELLTKSLNLSKSLTFILPLFFVTLAGLMLIISKNAYKKLLFLQKINISILFLISIFLFIFYFDFQEFLNLFKGFLGLGNDYYFLPLGISLTVFLSAIVYAGSGGNLILANSFYLNQELKNQENKNIEEKNLYQKYLKHNFYFFFLGGLLIISILSYISYVSLKSVDVVLNKDFSFLIFESQKFTQDISVWVGLVFLFSGAFAIFGVQIGIYDFLGRLVKNIYKKEKEKQNINLSDKKLKKVYNISVFAIAFFGFLVLLSGFDQPKSLITTGAIINALSMAVLSLLLFFVEIKLFQKIYKKGDFSKTKILFYKFITLFMFLFYFSFFVYVARDLF